MLVNRGYKVKIKHTDTNIKAENIDYQVIYDRCFNRRFNTELLSKYMDTESMIGMEYGLAQSLNTFLNNPEFNPKMQNWSYQAELDKIAGEYADYKEFQTFNEWGKYILLRILPISKLKRKLKNVYYFGKCKNCDKTIKRA